VASSMSQVTIDDLYGEIKKVNLRLESIERALETLLDTILPEEEIDKEEWREIQDIEAEIEGEKCLSLEEVRKKHGVK